MKKEPPSIQVSIFDRSLRIACSEDEKAALLAAVDYLDRKMREIQAAGKVVGAERVAIMAALNIAHELLTMRAGGFDIGELKRRMQMMTSTIDAALDSQSELF